VVEPLEVRQRVIRSLSAVAAQGAA
jgi:hypothetical protein